MRECLDSIQKQTYPNFECIMVNDGSTDNSKQIAEEYLVDSRFKLINQSNQGLSSARNTENHEEEILKNTSLIIFLFYYKFL